MARDGAEGLKLTSASAAGRYKPNAAGRELLCWSVGLVHPGCHWDDDGDHVTHLGRATAQLELPKCPAVNPECTR